MKVFERKTVFNGPVFDIEQLEVQVGLKGSHLFQVIRHPGGAGVLPVHGDGTVTLIRQLRPAVDALLLEIPAGRLDNAEAPLLCARRELLEETGLRGGQIIPLGLIHSSPGVFDEVIHLYAATDLSEGEAEPEADEDIEIVRVKLADALEMAADGRISDAKTIAALLRWQLFSERAGNCHA